MRGLFFLFIATLISVTSQAQIASTSRQGTVQIGPGLSMNNGVLSVTGGGGGSTFVPSILRVYNAAWMSTAPEAITSGGAYTSGQANLYELYAERDYDVTEVFYEVIAPASSGLTANTGTAIKNGFVLLDGSGGYLAHADGTSDFGTSGFKRTNLNQTVSVTAGTKYYLLAISTGTTPVAMRYTDNLSGKAATGAGRTSGPFVVGTKTVDGITSGSLNLTTGWTAKNTNRFWLGIGN